jgi:hypothetical protein
MGLNYCVHVSDIHKEDGFVQIVQCLSVSTTSKYPPQVSFTLFVIVFLM